MPDVEDLADRLGFTDFSVIGISGGTPYALACLYRLGSRIETTTIISGMGPTRLRGALAGMDPRRRLVLELGSRWPLLARNPCAHWVERFKTNPERGLRRLVRTWSQADQALFEREDIFSLFLKDLHEVFNVGNGAETFVQELRLYRNHGFSLPQLPRQQVVTLWHGSEDTIVPPAMPWAMAQALPRCELHLHPGGHFVAITIASLIIQRLKKQLEVLT